MLEGIKENWAKLRGEMHSFLHQEICPFCFEKFRLRDTPFRCASPPGRCAPEVDTVLQRVWEDQRPRGKVLTATGRFTAQMTCSDCEQTSHKRLCPHCHQELPHTFGEFRNYIFAVIGAKGAGKSHYIPVLIEELKHRIGPHMGFVIKPVGDFTINRYRKDFYNPLYKQHRQLDATQSALTDSSIQLPMVFTLQFKGNKLFKKNTITQAITLVFFDTAGEDLNSEDIMSTVNKYIYRSHGILLLLDPLQLDDIRENLDIEQLPPQHTDTTDIIARITRLIRSGQNLRPNKQIDIPFALALSKIDALQHTELLEPDSLLNQSSEETIHAYFDRQQFNDIDKEVENLLNNWNSQYLLDGIKMDFQRHGFFALSALGASPTMQGKIPCIQPYRVEQPFLWLLQQHGLLKKSATSSELVRLDD